MADAPITHLHGDLHLDVSCPLRKPGDTLVAEVLIHPVLVAILPTDHAMDNAGLRIDPSSMRLLPASRRNWVREFTPQLLDSVGRQASFGCRHPIDAPAYVIRGRRCRLTDDSVDVEGQILSGCGGEFDRFLQAPGSRCGSSHGSAGSRATCTAGKLVESSRLLMDDSRGFRDGPGNASQRRPCRIKCSGYIACRGDLGPPS